MKLVSIYDINFNQLLVKLLMLKILLFKILYKIESKKFFLINKWKNILQKII